MECWYNKLICQPSLPHFTDIWFMPIRDEHKVGAYFLNFWGWTCRVAESQGDKAEPTMEREQPSPVAHTYSPSFPRGRSRKIDWAQGIEASVQHSETSLQNTENGVIDKRCLLVLFIVLGVMLASSTFINSLDTGSCSSSWSWTCYVAEAVLELFF